MIRILNSSTLEILETTTTHTSIIFNKSFADTGDFTLTLPPDFVSPNIIKNNYIVSKNNIGIIKYISKTDTGFTIKGNDVKGILKQRCVKGTFSGTIETVMKKIVTENTTGNRSFPCFMIAEDTAKGEEIEYTATGETVADALKNISEKYTVGWDITLRNNQLIFDVIFPKETDVYYSVRHGNVSSYSYELNALNEKNTVYNFETDTGLELYINSTTNTVWVKSGSCYLSNDELFFKTNNDINLNMSYAINANSYMCYFLLYQYGGFTFHYQHGLNKIYGNGTIPQKYLGYSYLSNVYTATPVEHKIFVNDENTGLNRTETFVEQGGSIEDILEKTASEIETEVENATANIVTYSDYLNKWSVGDYVKIRLEIMGQTIIFNKQITAVQIVEEADNKRIIPTFGKTKNILKKLLKGVI